MKDAEIYRSAMQIIQKCGKDQDPKAYAFAMAADFHEKGNIEEATRWAEIANAIDILLQDIPTPEQIPTAVH